MQVLNILESVLYVGYGVGVALVLSGIILLLRPELNPGHRWVVRIAWVVTLQIIGLGAGAHFRDFAVASTASVYGYLVALLGVMLLLGAGRPPGETEDRKAGSTDHENARRQLIRISGISSIVVGIAYFFVVWRLTGFFAFA